MVTVIPRLGEFLEVVLGHAKTRGDSLAIIDESQQVTYRDLAVAVSARAEALRAAGMQSGDRFAVVAENSAAYLIAVLAVWSVDGVPATIYPSTSEADLRATLEDADPVLAFCDEKTESLVQAAAGDRIEVVRLDLDEPIAPRTDSATPTPEKLRDELALICYSSGTTARPKAIMLSARAVENGARTFGEAWRLSEEDATLVCLPMAWLFGLTTASMTSLYAGGTVVSRRRSRPELIAEAVDSHGVTFIPAVTTVLTKLANYLDAADEEWDLRSLRLIVSGGEPRNESSFAKLRTYTGIPVHDNYCASEMQPLVTYDPHIDPEPRPGSAGRLVPRSELQILNESGDPVAPGEIGEGFSRGPGLMLGYWNDPDSTRAALTADGWYRTNDLLRMDDEGYVSVVGRTSDMIIRGGSNVSPSEIEQHIRQHETVVDLAVVGVPDELYGEEIVAVIQVKPGTQFDVEALRDFARSGLAGFKVPTRYVQVEGLPHNATTGKVNRKAVKQRLKEGSLA